MQAPAERTRYSLTNDEAARYLGLRPNTLEIWRHTSKKSGRTIGPPYTMIGSRVRYSQADLDAWVAAHVKDAVATANA